VGEPFRRDPPIPRWADVEHPRLPVHVVCRRVAAE
jgi:hypothetical protein